MKYIYSFKSIQKECEFIANKTSTLDKKVVIFYLRDTYVKYIPFLLESLYGYDFSDTSKNIQQEISWVDIFLNGINPVSMSKISNQDRFEILSYVKNSKNELIKEEFDKVELYIQKYSFKDSKTVDEIKSFFADFPFFKNLDSFSSNKILTLPSFLMEYKNFLLSLTKRDYNNISFINYSLFNTYSFSPEEVYFCSNLGDFPELKNIDFDKLFASNAEYYLSYFFLDNRISIEPLKQISTPDFNLIKPGRISMSSPLTNSFGKLDVSNLNISPIINNGLAVTKIKRFIDCPNYFWISLFDRTRFQLKNSSTSLGSACHFLISKYIEGIISDSSGFLTKNDEEITEIVSSFCNLPAFEDFILDDIHKNLAILKSVKTIRETVDFYNNSNFIPAATETKLGENFAFSLKTEKGDNVTINGILDRVDKLKESNSYTVVDFKTGQSSFSQNDFQLSLYAAGLKNSFPDSNIVGIFSQKLSESMTDLEAPNTSKTLLSGPYNIDNIKDFDHNIDSESNIIKYKLNKDGSLSKTSSAVSQEEINELIDENVKKATEAVNKIQDKHSENSFSLEKCKNCPYNHICR